MTDTNHTNADGQQTPENKDAVATPAAATNNATDSATDNATAAATNANAGANSNSNPNAIIKPPLPSQLDAEAQPWRHMMHVVAARLRAFSLSTGRRLTKRTLKIGVSARIFHPQEGSKGLSSKTLQYLEESIAHWVMSRDVMVFMIPSVNTSGMIHPSNIRLRDYARHLDGLVLQGGADVAPETYAQIATKKEWSGDKVRDAYELELLHEFIEAGKPLLGVCRGCQLLNVAFGGTLYQDIATEVPNAIPHVSDLYDKNEHELRLIQGSSLSRMFPANITPLVNSIHHQAIHTLGRDMALEAVSAKDNIVEAIRYKKANFVMGVQWHPEFHPAGHAGLLDCTPILDSFLRAARETRF